MASYRVFMDLATTLLAIFVGAIIHKKLSEFLTILLYQAVLYFIVDLFATAIKGSNAWIYNVYFPSEIALLFTAVKKVFPARKNENYLLFLFVIFSFIYCIELCIVNIKTHLLFVTILAAYIMETTVYIYLIYISFETSESKRLNIPLIAASIGIVIYCAGCIPCLSLIKYLINKNSLFATDIYQKIIVQLGSIRYLMLAFAYFIYARGIIRK